MVDLSKFLDGLIAINVAAHQAENLFERDTWFRLKTQLISTAITILPEESLHLGFQVRNSHHGLDVLATFLVRGRGNRPFHTPYGQLTGEAKLLVVKALGCPYVFLANNH